MALLGLQRLEESKAVCRTVGRVNDERLVNIDGSGKEL